MDSIWVEVFLIGVSILAHAFFAGSEIALVSARPSRLSQLRARGVPGADVAEALKKDPDAFLATIQMAITLVGMLGAWGRSVALAIVVLAIAFVSLLIGELTPKALALRNPERLAALVARPVAGLMRLLAGPGRALTCATRVLLTALGQSGTPVASLVSEEEVKYLVREGTAQGVFEAAERDLVNRVFQFADTPVRLVMVPRPNILGLDIE